MKLRKTKRIRAQRLGKRQIQKYYENIDREVSNLAEEDQKKLEFARNFINEIILIDPEGTQTQISPLDLKNLQYLAFSILIEYDIKYHNRNI